MQKKYSFSMEEEISLLRSLIGIPSFSREEGPAADLLEGWLTERGLSPRRVGNNLYCFVEDPATSSKPLLLLNAHIDTVRPVASYTRDPFSADIEDVLVDGKPQETLFGLGSNDDGGSIAALIKTYRILSSTTQSYNLVLSLTAEEEVCGREGLEALFPYLGKVALGVYGEPTGMQMAVAERGLMVLDCTVRGRSGHAAREEGINAIYEALPWIEWFRSNSFEKVSPYLGSVKMTVTQIQAGTQHNVVPDKCTFVVDVRPNGLYTNQEILSYIKENVRCEVKERSTRLSSSHISLDHPVVRKGLALGLTAFGSPTTSNQTVSPFTTIKIGPGQSSRSHGADEFIRIEELYEGVEIYCALLDGLDLI